MRAAGAKIACVGEVVMDLMLVQLLQAATCVLGPCFQEEWR